MGEHEMFKTTLMGGYDKEEVQELIQKMKDEMAEVQVNYRKQLVNEMRGLPSFRNVLN